MLRCIVSGLVAILFGYSCYWSVRLAIADQFARNRSRSAIEHAIRLAPDNPESYLRLAEADPALAPAAIRRAAELNPMNSSVWLEFGRTLEEHQDYQAAETYLLHAVQLDRTFAPRWLLAQYYFRRKDSAHFWPAVRSALTASYDDITPLLEMCWKLAPEPGTIFGEALPNRPDVLRQYLDFLLAQNRPDLAPPVVNQLLHNPAPDVVRSLLSYCDLLLSKGQLSPPLEIWNALALQRLLKDPPLAPDRGLSLTNGRFEFPFLSRGFDWRLSMPEGILSDRRDFPALLRFEFSGKQPENCELLSQWLPLEPSRKYRLTVAYRTVGLAGKTGLQWRVLDAGAGSDLLPEALLPAGGDSEPMSQEYGFSVPHAVRLGRLTLAYHRIPGTVRIAGSLSLRAVKLAFAE